MDTPRPDRRVAALVALKTLPTAKSRLSELPAEFRRQLARCMALDTIAALAAATDEVLVITDQPDFSASLLEYGISATVLTEPPPDPRPLPQPEPAHAEQPPDGAEASLNAALAYGDRILRANGAPIVLACVGDLPALRANSVRRILASAAELAAEGSPRAFVADRSGRGTTILIAHGVPLDPRFGSGGTVGSARRHQLSGATTVTTTGIDDARWDVDTLADLHAVTGLDVGRATASVLAIAAGPV